MTTGPFVGVCLNVDGGTMTITCIRPDREEALKVCEKYRTKDCHVIALDACDRANPPEIYTWLTGVCGLDDADARALMTMFVESMSKKLKAIAAKKKDSRNEVPSVRFRYEGVDNPEG